MNLATGQERSLGLIVTCKAGLVIGLMQRRSLLRSYVQRFSVLSLIWMASYGMRVISAIGLRS